MVLYNSPNIYNVALVHFGYSGDIVLVRKFAFNIAKQPAVSKNILNDPLKIGFSGYTPDWHFGRKIPPGKIAEKSRLIVFIGRVDALDIS